MQKVGPEAIIGFSNCRHPMNEKNEIINFNCRAVGNLCRPLVSN